MSVHCSGLGVASFAADVMPYPQLVLENGGTGRPSRFLAPIFPPTGRRSVKQSSGSGTTEG